MQVLILTVPSTDGAGVVEAAHVANELDPERLVALRELAREVDAKVHIITPELTINDVEQLLNDVKEEQEA